jgi:hypothetical protein
MMTKTRLTALALAAATFATALVIDGNAEAAPKGGQLTNPVHVAPPRRVHPADCVELKDGSKVLCTTGGEIVTAIFTLGGLRAP